MQTMETVSEYDRTLHDVANRILGVIFAQRRLLPGEAEKEEMFHVEAAPHIEKVLRCVAANAPVTLVLPAFPAKSTSRAKTLGHLPDLGEQVCCLMDENDEAGVVLCAVYSSADPPPDVRRRQCLGHRRAHPP